MTMPVAIITGASGGIGLSTVHTFLAAGWQVLAASRSPELIPAHANLVTVRCDPVLAEDRRLLVEVIEHNYGGKLNCLVNNAGYAQAGPIELVDETAWKEQLDVNLVAPALLTSALLPALRHAQGSVINISSVLGRMAYAWQGAYCASKFGLEAWSESLMLETQEQGIRVHLIEPGATRSEFGRRMRCAVVDDGTYLNAARRFSLLRQRLAERAQPAQAVADAILHAAQDPRVPFRCLVGRDARLVSVLLAWLPDYARVAVSRRLTRKLLG